MNKKLATTIVLGATLGLFFSANAQSEYNPIPSSVQMLNIAPEARGTGMGDVGVATTPDINSQHWNPAKYAFMDSKSGVSISITPWLRKLVNDINLFYLAGYYKIDSRNNVSASIRYFSLGDLVFYDEIGNEQGTYKPSEFAIDAAYALRLATDWSGSVALRFIHSDLGYQQEDDSYSPGNAFAADIAFYYNKKISIAREQSANLMFGVNISNIGTKITYDDGNTNEYLPANLKIGAGFWYDIDSYNRIGAAIDFNKLLVPTPTYRYTGEETEEDAYTRRMKYYDQSVVKSIFTSFSDAPRGGEEEWEEVDIMGGIEYTYKKLFSARAGYHNNPENKGNLKYASVGLGVKYQMFNVDASYIFPVGQANSNSALANTVRITLGFDLSKVLKK